MIAHISQSIKKQKKNFGEIINKLIVKYHNEFNFVFIKESSKGSSGISNNDGKHLVTSSVTEEMQFNKTMLRLKSNGLSYCNSLLEACFNVQDINILYLHYKYILFGCLPFGELPPRCCLFQAFLSFLTVMFLSYILLHVLHLKSIPSHCHDIYVLLTLT